jgi:hypothetical protein
MDGDNARLGSILHMQIGLFFLFDLQETMMMEMRAWKVKNDAIRC